MFADWGRNIVSDVVSVYNTAFDKLFPVVGSLLDNLKSGFSNINNGMTNFWESLKGGFSNMNDGMTNLWDSLKGGFSNMNDGMSGLGDNLKGGFLNISRWFDNLWSNLKGGFDNICSFLSNFGRWFSDFFENSKKFLHNLFVPRDNYFSDNFNLIRENMLSKVGGNSNDLDFLKGVSSSNPICKKTFTLFGVSLQIDFSFINQIVDITRGISSGMVFIFLAWYNYKKVVWLIRGTAPIEGHGQFGNQLRG